MYVCATCICLAPGRQKGHELPWGPRRLWASMWVPGSKLGSWATGTLSLWAVSPAHNQASLYGFRVDCQSSGPFWPLWLLQKSSHFYWNDSYKFSNQDYLCNHFKKKILPPFTVITSRENHMETGTRISSLWLTLGTVWQGFLATSLQSVILSWPTRDFIWCWWHIFQIIFLTW